jgi:hypothetical protein
METNIFYQLWDEHEPLCNVSLVEYTVKREVSQVQSFNGVSVHCNLGKTTATGSFKICDLSVMDKLIYEYFSYLDLVFFSEQIMKSNIYITSTRLSEEIIMCEFSGTGLVKVPTELKYLLEITKRQNNE